MRRAGGLFRRIHDFDNLLQAAHRAQRGKRYRPDVLRFNRVREDHLHRLSRELAAGAWYPSGHRHFQVREPKRRWISAAPYADRVVHHAICNVIEPEIDRRLIFDCWANRRGKGSHRAVLRYQRFAWGHRYALKIDLTKYFPSIDHEILKTRFRRLFKERPLLTLLDRIVDQGESPEPFRAYFPGDDLFTPWQRRQGLPIGNLTSQIWANVYLDGFDHWVKEHLHCRGYLRFVDDFVLLHDDKEILREWLHRIKGKLAELRLLTHPRKSVIRQCEEGLPFLGYMIWPNRIRVRGETVRRYRRRLRRRAQAGEAPESLRRSLAAWRGHVEIAGGWRRVQQLPP